MNRLRIAFILGVLAAPAWAAIAYSRFAHPKGDYVLEYPSDWKRSYGIETLWLRPPGREGSDVKIGLERYPIARDAPPTPKAFVAGLMEPVGLIKKLDSRATVMLSGRKAERLALTETAELKDQYGQKLPGPLREVYLVVPLKAKSYYVLSIQGIGAAFEKALPEFERMAEKLQLELPTPKAKP